MEASVIEIKVRGFHVPESPPCGKDVAGRLLGKIEKSISYMVICGTLFTPEVYSLNCLSYRCPGNNIFHPRHFFLDTCIGVHI
jgi:hypothetical protein